MRAPTAIAALLLLGFAGLPAVGLCQDAAPAEPPPGVCSPGEPEVRRGFVLRAALGPAFWTGAVGESSQAGVGFTFGLGYEVLPFFAFEASFAAAFHQTRQPYPPAASSFTTLAGHGGFRLTVPLGRLDLFARTGIGLLWAGPNVLVRLPQFDARHKLSWLAGAGLTWHSANPRIWIGIEGSANGAGDLPGIWILGSVVMGMTF